MKPKLLLGNRNSGKTKRLLETVMWLKALIICPSQIHATALRQSCKGSPAFDRVEFISCKNKYHFEGREYDIICIDEWRVCAQKNDLIFRATYQSKIQPVLTERLDTENFDVEVLYAEG